MKGVTQFSVQWMLVEMRPSEKSSQCFKDSFFSKMCNRFSNDTLREAQCPPASNKRQLDGPDLLMVWEEGGGREGERFHLSNF